jgi:hypothetical protein
MIHFPALRCQFLRSRFNGIVEKNTCFARLSSASYPEAPMR